MNILVDVDSTTLNLMPEWLRLYNYDYSDALTPDMITEWDMTKFVNGICGKKIYEYLANPFLYDYVQPIDGAVEGVKYIRSRGHRVIFVSAGVYASGKYDCLVRHGFEPGKYAEDFIVAYDKSIICGDVLIDDKPENVVSFSGRVALLFDQPWNRSFQWENRVLSWDDIFQEFVGRTR